MSQNDEILREEFQTQVTEAYNGVSLDAVTKAEYRQKIFAKAKKKSARNKYFKVTAVIGACLVFVVANIAIITLNMKHGKPAEEVTNGTKTTEYISEFTNIQVGDVIYEVLVKNDYTVQVVVKDIAIANSTEINAKINNAKKVTGKFVLRVVDKEGVIHGEADLICGAVSEYGLSLPFDEANLKEQFVAYDDVIAFRHLMSEKDGQAEYLTTFYGVDAEGNIFHYELDVDGEWNNRYMSQFDMVTSENFAMIPNKYGTFRDYFVADEKAYLIYYGFNENAGKVSVYMNFSGNQTGPETNSVQDYFEEKCRIEGTVFMQVFLSEDVVEANSNAYNVYVGVYDYSEEKLYRMYVTELGTGWSLGQIVEIPIDSMKNDIINEKVTDDNVINSAEDFFAAYPGGIIEGTDADYLTNGQGEALNEKAIKDKSGAYSDLFEPELAAMRLLNVDLSNEGSKAYTTMEPDSSGVTVCFEFAKTGKCVYVKMIKPFGGDGIWIPQSEKGNYEETVVNVIETDLTHDGIDDYIVTSLRSMYGSEEKYTKGQDVEEFFYNSPTLCYVRVYSGGGKSTESSFDSDDCIWWQEFATTRPCNGFVVLVEDSGKNYLMTGMLNEQQGTGDYKYEVLDLGDLLKNIDLYSVGFATENPEDRDIPMPQKNRSQVVPDFRTHIEKWFDGATLIVAFDVLDEKGLYITTDAQIYMPNDYFDGIWNRKDDY